MIYTHVLNRGNAHLRTPANGCRAVLHRLHKPHPVPEMTSYAEGRRLRCVLHSLP